MMDRLPIDMSKTKYILLHPKLKDVSYVIPTLNGDKIEKVDSYNIFLV